MNISRNQRDEILFHIGIHKTASSSLQEGLFVPKNGFHSLERNKLLRYFVDKFSTELLSSRELDDLQLFIKQSYASQLYPVASHERLSGYPLFGGYDRESIFKRISQSGLNIKILFIIREQNSWIYSAWKQLINDGANLSLNKFIDVKPDHPDLILPSLFRLEYLNYSREIEELYKLFGKNNVCVVPMELIINDYSCFIDKLEKVIDFDFNINKLDSLNWLNKSDKLSSIYIQKFLNTLLYKTSSSPFGLLDERYDLVRSLRGRLINLTNKIPEIPWAFKLVSLHKDKINKSVGNYYAESNAKTSELIGVELGNFGYTTSSSF